MRPVLERRLRVNFFKNRPLVITIIIVILLMLLMVATASSNAFSEKTTIAGSAFVPLQRFFYQISDSIAGFFSGDNADLAEDNDRLLSELDTYKTQLMDYEELKQENERLAAALEYKQNNENQELKIAKITGKEPGNWFDVFTIDLGSRDGIKENMPVITPDGLVGRVEEVGLNWSKVTGIIDGRSRISAIMERTRDVGIASGRIGIDELSATLRMEYLPLDSDIVEGDIVVTSGLDGVFPKGLVIGSVAGASSDTGGTNVTIKPNVDFRRLEEVMVVIRSEDTNSVVSESIADENAVVAPLEEPSEAPAGEE